MAGPGPSFLWLHGSLHSAPPWVPTVPCRAAFLSLVGNTNNHSLPTLGLASWSLYLFILILTVLGSSLWHVGLVAWPGIEPESPASEGRVLTTGPPGRSLLESWELFRWTFSQKQPPFQRRSKTPFAGGKVFFAEHSKQLAVAHIPVLGVCVCLHGNSNKACGPLWVPGTTQPPSFFL